MGEHQRVTKYQIHDAHSITCSTCAMAHGFRGRGEAFGGSHIHRECQKNVEFCILLAFGKTLYNEQNDYVMNRKYIETKWLSSGRYTDISERSKGDFAEQKVAIETNGD